MARKVIKRHEYADYLNVGTQGTAEWVLMGVGFTTLDEEPNAQTETVKYICDRSSSSSVIGYETSFPYEAEQIADEKAIDAIYTVGRNHYVGEDAEMEYCRVELWNKASAANTYEARKFLVSVEVSSISGENKMAISGNLNAIGDPVLGTFNTTTKTFEESAIEAD